MSDPVVDNRAKYLHGLPKKKLTFQQKIRRVSRILREEVETLHPVRVRTVAPNPTLKKLNALGYCYLANENKPKDKRYFVIVIPRSTSPDDVVELLIHEWAHCMTWFEDHKGDHGPAWAKAYGQLYQLVLDD